MEVPYTTPVDFESHVTDSRGHNFKIVFPGKSNIISYVSESDIAIGNALWVRFSFCYGVYNYSLLWSNTFPAPPGTVIVKISPDTAIAGIHLYDPDKYIDTATTVHLAVPHPKFTL